MESILAWILDLMQIAGGQRLCEDGCAIWLEERTGAKMFGSGHLFRLSDWP